MSPVPAPMSAAATQQMRLQVDYTPLQSLGSELAAADTLAVLGFGPQAPTHHDPRYLRVPLQPHGEAPLEIWRAAGPVRHGRQGD
ncbi:MAG TPA: pteridine-dependent deoxygenase, partial [Xanthomonadaceae bacterium]|nr:pteridine-dependent deoxygenase [Xanthomonadaceae bacterium]